MAADAVTAPRGKRLLVLKGLLLLAVLSFAVWVNLRAGDLAAVEDSVLAWGYPGLFAVSALSGFNLLVPIPVVVFFPFFMEIGLHRGLTLIVIAFGMTTGDLAGFLLGSVSRQVIEIKEGRMMRALRDLGHRRWIAYAALFLYAGFVPLPNELIVIPMAFLGFSLGGIFLAALFGNLIFNSLAALGLTGMFGGA